MKRNYWEKIAPAYDDEIFDVLANDKKAIIRSAIKKYASKKKTVIDIGSGIGKWIPVLSPSFKKVIAVDISAKNLAIARKQYPQYKNIEWLRANMSRKTVKVPKADVGICINAILTPSQKERINFFQSISACIKKGGHIIITIPSLESWLLTNIIQQHWKIDNTLFPAEKKARVAVRKWNNIRQGIVEIDEVPHKHYLEDELQLLLAKEKFRTEHIQKIEYEWSTEFLKPPGWLKDPRPWDWMVVAKKL